MSSGQTQPEGPVRMLEGHRGAGAVLGRGLWHLLAVRPACRGVDAHWPPCALLQDVGLLEYQHHSRDYTSHLSPGSIIQPQRRRPSLLSEFQPGNER